MTIRGLYKLICDKAASAVRAAKLADLSGETAYIDANLLIYQWIAAGISGGIYDPAGKHINHIQGCLWRTTRLIAAGVRPVYVFDGPPPAEKAPLIEQRRQTRAVSVPRYVYTEVRELLQLIGVPAIAAPGEAEAYAAALARAGGDSIVITDDSDCIVFGAPRMVRLGAGDNITIVDRAAALDALGISGEMLIDLAILLGCDYTGRVAGVGPVRALKLIHEYSSIEAAIAAGAIAPGADFNYAGARAIFAEKPAAGPVPAAGYAGGVALREFLTAHGLDPARFDKAVGILEK